MRAIKAKFDGRQIILPEKMPGIAPGDVILVFEESGDESSEWLQAQEQAFAKAWDNNEDAVYDAM